LTAAGWTPATAAVNLSEIASSATVGIECSGFIEFNGKLGRNRAAVRRSGVALEGAAKTQADVCRFQVVGILMGQKKVREIFYN
jgi:hypothetical protein